MPLFFIIRPIIYLEKITLKYCEHAHFAGVHELRVGEDIKVIFNLNERQKIIFNCLGERYWGVYS